MSKRIYLYILLVATFFCSSCNFSASEEKFLNESELSFSISRNVLAQIDSSVETTVTIHTEVLKENTVIIDNLQDRKLLFNENNEPYLESITLNKVPLYCPLVFKMQVLIDSIILGCTHYPLLMEKIKKYIPNHVKVVSQGEYVANSLRSYLERHEDIASVCSNGRTCKFLTTENPKKFSESASIFLNSSIDAERVVLE